MEYLRNLMVILAIAAVATLTGDGVHGQTESAPPWSFMRTLRVGDTSFKVAVADSADERMRGLSGLRRMEPNEGLYFVFPTPRPLTFWMKDMQFLLDIAWIDKHHRIIQIMENVAPETFPAWLVSLQPAQYALEINAGRARETDIEIGDVVTLQ